METTPSPQFRQRRKFFLVLPLLMVPFITLIFWLLDGGKVKETQAQAHLIPKGLNLELPTAYLDDKPLNKLSYYEKAASDSVRLEKLIKSDPYYRSPLKARAPETGLTAAGGAADKNSQPPAANRLNTSLLDQPNAPEYNEAQVYQKLEALHTALNKADKAPVASPASSTELPHYSGTAKNQVEMDRLEQMMGLMQKNEGTEDPEMKQINAMLEKILDIQHPERVREKQQPASPVHAGQALSAVLNKEEPISLLVGTKSISIPGLSQADDRSTNDGFYSLEEDETISTAAQNTIPAVLPETQTLVDGAVVKLRLGRDVSLNGVLIPAGNFVFGTASLQGERLHIKIDRIRYLHDIFPVDLAVYDLDGMTGIYIPGAITREVAQQSTNQALQRIGLNTLDPSLGVQAASASLEAAKTLLHKKTKQVKVTVKAGFQVLLHDEKQKNFSRARGMLKKDLSK